MKISKDTKVCISLAKTAGNFGTTIYNHVFEKLGIDFIYKSFSTQDLEAAVLGAKAIGICGISVTMPYKTEVLKLATKQKLQYVFVVHSLPFTRQKTRLFYKEKTL